ncbi:MAG TPA: four helix bundle protein, partial [Thermoanaerobaculia bacterium]
MPVAGCRGTFVPHGSGLSLASTAMAKTFEDLDVFKRALDLMVDVYEATAGFPQREVYGLAAQLRRASVSVVSNIAEGQGRLTPGEWRQLLSHARGSLFEIEAQLIASAMLGFMDSATAKRVRAMA